MQLSNIPGKLVLPFASTGNKNSIPVNSQIGVTPGAASLADGFPPLTMTPVAAGGVPPSGLDMNGILFELSAVVRWANAGGGYPFDADFATDINVNGYPKGARVLRADGSGYWFNTVDGNITDPDSSSAVGWLPDFTNGAAVIPMASANVTLAPVQYGKPIIVITGLLTSDLNLIFPNIQNEWTVINQTTGGYMITAKTATGSGAKLWPDFIGRIVAYDNTIKIENDFNSVPNVVHFGAKGNGATDDTAAFTSALADANSTNGVYVPNGVYVIEGLAISGKKLFGPGTIKWKSSASASAIILSGDKCCLEGLTFDGNKENQTSDLTMIRTVSAPNAVIRGCRITNGRYKFFQTDVANSPGCRVENNFAVNWGANPSTGANVFDFRSSYFSAIGNHFEGTGMGHNIRTGVYESDPQTPVVGGTIVGNVFRNCVYSGIVVELMTQELAISGNVFDGLQQGVKIESDGGTQFDISIVGNTFRNLTIPTAFNFTGTRVTVVGNTMLDCAGGIDLGPNSICSGNIIKNCASVSNSIASIRASSAATGCVVSDNIILNSPYRGIDIGGNRCRVSGNKIYQPANIGLNVTSADCEVIGNSVSGGTTGIVVNSTNGIMVANRASGASTANYSGVSNATQYADMSNWGWTGWDSSLSMVSGVITVPRLAPVLSIRVDTESGAASGDLVTINANGPGFVGQQIILRNQNTARTVVVKNGIGNIRLNGSDFSMSNGRARLTLVYNGSGWDEVARAANP